MISPDQVILTCYELAKFYQVDPRIFLNQKVSEIGRHRHWTRMLTDRIREQQEADAADER
jgi:hypothetical protein